jgi:peroxiredoxin
VNVFGVSFQDPDWQAEFAIRCAIRFPLLSDQEQTVSRALSLPVFVAGGKAYLKRLTLLVNNGRIAGLRFPVADPHGDAEAMLALLGAPAA